MREVMRCNWVQDRLLLFLAAELGNSETARVVSHLERCEACSALLDEISESQGSLRDAVSTTATPPESLDARIMERVESLPLRRFPWPVQMQIWDRRSILAFSACGAVLLLIGFQWGRMIRPTISVRLPGDAAARPILDMADLARAHLSWNASVLTDPVDEIKLANSLSHSAGLRIIPLEMTDKQLELKAGSVTQMNRVPVATMRYTWKGTPVTLVQADGMKLSPPTTLKEMRDHGRCFLIEQNGDLTTVLWCEGSDNFILMARLPPQKLFPLACLVSAKLKRG